MLLETGTGNWGKSLHGAEPAIAGDWEPVEPAKGGLGVPYPGLQP